jgi:hypothetical protein
MLVITLDSDSAAGDPSLITGCRSIGLVRFS